MTNQIGLDEKNAENNHGTWYDNQIVAYSLFIGKTDIAKQVPDNVKSRIAKQIEADGTMPLEMGRTRSLHYPVYNLHGFYNLAKLGDQVGVDLWNYQNEDGRSIHKALDYLTPFISGYKKWELDQVVNESFTEAIPLLVSSTSKYNNSAYLDAAKQILKDNRDAQENILYEDLLE